MIKIFKKKQPKERAQISQSVQDTIPIKKFWKDGIFLVGNSRYSMTLKFTDVNFAIASEEDKESMLADYDELLCSLPVGATVAVTVNNKHFDKEQFESAILMKMKRDDLDYLRVENNDILMSKATSTNNSIVRERYITISVQKKNIEEARIFFRRTVVDLRAKLKKLGSLITELDTEERLRIFHDFYRTGNEQNFTIDIKETASRGHSVKDYICPSGMKIHKDCFEMDGKFGRVLFMRNYASNIDPRLITKLTDLPRKMMVTMEFIPKPMYEALKEVSKRIMGVETNIANFQRRQNKNNNFSAVVPYEMELQRAESREIQADMMERDKHMLEGLLTVVHVADSRAQLESDTESLMSLALGEGCGLSILNFQQEDGLQTVLPFGTSKVQARRTLTSEAATFSMPFNAQEIMQEGGVYYGQNAISNNMIVADRMQLANGNGIILGSSGSGKSVMGKCEMEVKILSTDDDIISIDPDGEFRKMTEMLGGEVIKISSNSDNHINPLDMAEGYSNEDNPILIKNKFIMSLCEQANRSEPLSPQCHSIIDRALKKVYRPYIKGEAETPTLKEFYDVLLTMEEPEAKEVALIMERFVEGSLNTFAHKTNVNTKSRIICYDIRELDNHLLPIGMLVVFDAIFNRIVRNRKLGKRTWIYVDEMHLMFKHEYTADFFSTIWKRVRKYGAFATAITQNVTDMLQSKTASTMIANSEFLIMLNQGREDSEQLARLLSISDEHLSYVTNAGIGRGLIKCGRAIVPFVNEIPKDTHLYRMVTTKPGEVDFFE